MRIIHVVDYFMPRLGYQDYFLAKAQIKQGHEVIVITSDRYRPFPNYNDSVRKILGPRLVGAGKRIEEGVPVIRLPVILEIRYRCLLNGLEREILRLHPDLIISHGVGNFSTFRLSILKRKLPEFRKWKLIADSHMVFQNQKKEILGHFFYMFYRKMLKGIVQDQVDGLVAVTQDTKVFLRKMYGFPEEIIHIIPLGVDLDRFRFEVKARKEIREKLNIRYDEIVFIYSGKLVPEKCPHMLVKAALILLEEGKSFKVILLGDGPENYIDSMKNEILRFKKSESFFVLKPVPNYELYKYYSAADIGVWPCKSSLTMLEAQACGIPIIVSDFPPASERIVNGNGLIFKSGDVEDLANKMRILLENPKMRLKMGEKGKELAKNMWSYDIISERFLKIVGK